MWPTEIVSRHDVVDDGLITDIAKIPHKGLFSTSKYLPHGHTKSPNIAFLGPKAVPDQQQVMQGRKLRESLPARGGSGNSTEGKRDGFKG